MLHHGFLLRDALWIHRLRMMILFAPFLAFAYYLVAAVCARLFFRRGLPLGSEFAPSISILKPVRGVDRGAYENFSSFCRLDYPQYEILFGVADPRDPSVPIIQKLIRDFPEQSIRLFAGMTKCGPNEKASILAHLAHEARYDHFVMSDSDTRVAPDCLRVVAEAFRDPEVGAVSCLYHCEGANTLADALEGVSISSDFLASVLVAEQFGGAKFALGAAMATTRERLEGIGGFQALSEYLLDDYELGRRIAAQGYRVELSPYTISIVLPSQTIRAYWERQLRWAVGVRNSRPWSYAGLLFTQGLPLTLAAIAIARSIREAVFFLSAYFATRYFMAWTVGVLGLRDSVLCRKWWLIPLCDAIAFGTWITGLGFSRVHWRGDRFYIRNGRMTPGGAAGSQT